jgi:hypothetical protein
MASSYSQYKIELQNTGENSGTWGTITNANFGSATPGVYQGFEQAIGGRADVTMSTTTVTLTLTDTNAAQDARALYLNLSGTPGGAADLVVPALQKAYLVKNGTNAVVTIKVTGQTGVPIPVGKTVWVYNNGTDVVTAVDHIPSLTLGAALPVASGGTGITSFGTGVATALGQNVTGSGGIALATSPSITTPRVITSINDTNGNELFGVTATTSAVNEFTVANAATGNAPTLSATGGDTNIGMALTPKGTGGVIFPAGAVGTPAITTTGDLNTGIYFPAADTIGFVEGGAEAVRINSSGNVGIGTTSPGARLEVGSQTVGTYTPSAIFNGTSTAKFRIDDLSNVAQNRRFITNNYARPNGTLTADNSGYGVTSILFDDGFLTFGTAAAGSTSTTERMRIDSSGNVGIGTTSPATRLQVNGTVRVGATGTDGNLQLARTSDGAAVGAISWVNANTEFRLNNELSGPMSFYTNNTERARISSAGDFFVGTTSGSNPGVILFGGGVINATVPSGNCIQFWNQATSGDNGFATFYTEGGAGSLRGSIDYNRGAGLTRYNTTSDATLKNIIGDSDGAKSVEILNSTRIREFAWKDDSTQKPQIGVIAQELYETYKGAVSVGGDYEVTVPAVTEQRLVSEAVLDEDGNEIEAAVYETVEIEPERTEIKYRPWAVDKTAFTFHLVAGWQAHEKLIKQQAETIAALEARIAALEGN